MGEVWPSVFATVWPPLAISIETAGMLRDAGADRLIVGSAIFDNENVVDAYGKFENI